MPTFHLRLLPFPARLGLSGLMLVLLLGMGASAAHLFNHDKNRDESPQFTMDDVRAAYHGLDRPPILQTSLERGHPEALKPEQREVLLKWIRSARITEDYDSIDLGPASPSEIIASSCVSCHAASSADPKAAAIRFASLENLKKLASPKRVNVTPKSIVALSMHTHAPALGMLALVLAALLWLTRLHRGLAAAMIGLMGLALAADFASWWIARTFEPAVWAIVIGGSIANGLMVAINLIVLIDAWWPLRK